ncbi:MAG TPA: HAMP domain-containing histidine kinase [Sedimenticola sp.]|nr:HAMP domain-containing histidine kinase [Sedimenticola sp.]
MKSLELRLQLGLAMTLVLLLGAMWFIGSRALNGMTEGFIASRLEHDAEGLLAAMRFDPDSGAVAWRRLSQVYQQPLSGHYYVVRFADGHEERSRSLWDQTLDIPLLKPGERHRRRVAGPAGQRLLLLLNGYRKGGQTFTLGVAEDLSPVHAERDDFMRWFALLALGGLAGILLVQSLVVRRSFTRLERVRSDIRRLEQGRIEALSEDVPTEVLPLVQEFNRLLELLARRLERSRNSLGNLAHALKGPLNLLTHYFDAPEPDPEARRQAAIQTERIRQLMERELKRARLAGGELASRRFDPATEIPDLVLVLRQVHRERGIDIDCHLGEGVKPFGDREDMLELLGNLLDNACKWAASRVRCRIEVDRAGAVVIRVEDDGTGLGNEEIEHLTHRGTRLDETVEGHGLGLAIVGDIVKLYGGSIGFGRARELGGLGVQIQFPPAGGGRPPEDI